MFFQPSNKPKQPLKHFASKPFFAPSAQVIDDVIHEVEKRFVKGTIYSKQHSRIKDTTFKRKSNVVPDTNFAAATGPKNEKDLVKFFTDTIYRDPAIEYVIALGNRLSELNACPSGVDFLNYYMKENAYDVGPYHVNSRLIAGTFRTHPEKKESHPEVYTESEVTVRTQKESKRLTVIGIELKDGSFIDLKNDYDHKKKELLLKIFEIARNNQVLVHCKHGRGRTGHLILIMELLRNYESIFSCTDPEKITDNIFKILDNMRQARPGLVHTLNQIKEAIHDVLLLHRYMLSKDLAYSPVEHSQPESIIEAYTP